MANRAAYVDEAGARITVREAPFPELRPGYVIIKNATTAGSDVAGEIVEVGENVQHLKKGQRVVGHAFALLTGDSAEAAFQLYTLVPANMVAPIPDEMSFEAAVVLPLSVSCAAAALYEKKSLALPLPTTVPSGKTGDTILIWGGSSSVGSSAIQLGTASGFEVVATASPKNFEYVKSLGASVVFDYASNEITSELVNALKASKCVGAFDTVGQAVPQCIEVIRQLGGGHVVATSDPPKELPAGVTAKHVFATSIKDNDSGQAIYQDYLPAALADGRFQAQPKPTVVGEGLEQLQAGLDKLKAGVSAAKLVVTL